MLHKQHAHGSIDRLIFVRELVTFPKVSPSRTLVSSRLVSCDDRKELTSLGGKTTAHRLHAQESPERVSYNGRRHLQRPNRASLFHALLARRSTVQVGDLQGSKNGIQDMDGAGQVPWARRYSSCVYPTCGIVAIGRGVWYDRSGLGWWVR